MVVVLNTERDITTLCGHTQPAQGTLAYLDRLVLNLDNMLPQLPRIIDPHFRLEECLVFRTKGQQSAVRSKCMEACFELMRSLLGENFIFHWEECKLLHLKVFHSTNIKFLLPIPTLYTSSVAYPESGES